MPPWAAFFLAEGYDIATSRVIPTAITIANILYKALERNTPGVERREQRGKTEWKVAGAPLFRGTNGVSHFFSNSLRAQRAAEDAAEDEEAGAEAADEEKAEEAADVEEAEEAEEEEKDDE